MPVVHYGGRDGEAVELVEDADLLAVRTRGKRSLKQGPVAEPAAAALDGLDLVTAFPDAGVEVYRVSATAAATDASADLAATRDALRESPNVRFAGRVLVDATSRQPVLYTENLFVKFIDAVDHDHCLDVLAEHSLAVKEEVGYANNAFFVAAPEGIGQEVFALAERLLDRHDVEYCHPELIREARSRGIGAAQWHLQTSTLGSVIVNASANVAAAHAVTTGAGVVIAVIDTGIDIDHEEFSSPAKIVAPFDATANTADPRPRTNEFHGTACAGVACADGRFGASGVAPSAKLMPIRLQSGLGSQAEARAFAWAADHGADVISCSWGPSDGEWFNPADPVHRQRVALPDSTRVAIEYATTQGRGGKGCVLLFAAGNGNEPVANDGYASYEKVLAVAACNDRGRRSVYSDTGPAVFCAFPSNDFAFAPENRPTPLTPGIFTTDLTGGRGYSPTQYTATFGGTSSACPGAAGVAALVLSVRPELRREEVADILARACERIDPQEGGWGPDNRSPLYGHGRLDAAAAVRLAGRGTGGDVVTVGRTFAQPIPDRSQTSVQLDVTETSPLAGVAVVVDIEHTWTGDLRVQVEPPPATGIGPITLQARQGAGTPNVRRTFTATHAPGLADLAGISPAGTWTLRVADEAPRDMGVIRHFGLELTMQPIPPVRALLQDRERVLTVRFEAVLRPGDRASRDLVPDHLDLDRLPSGPDEVRVLLDTAEAIRTIEAGYEVHLVRVMPVQALDRSLVADDQPVQAWFEERVAGIAREDER